MFGPSFFADNAPKRSVVIIIIVPLSLKLTHSAGKYFLVLEFGHILQVISFSLTSGIKTVLSRSHVGVRYPQNV